MEFIDPKIKKKRLRRLFVGYGLLAILVGLATYILVATALGYEIFHTDGQVVQNGLLFLDSKPVSATIDINGKREASKTDAKLALEAGEYEVILKADGYKDWTKRINLEGGKVRFALYPRLFPETINAVDIKNLPLSNGFMTQSPDRRWLVMQTNTSVPSVDIFDLSLEKVTSSSFVLPPTALQSQDGSYGVFEVVEWANDNRHLLLSQKLPNGKVNYILLDRENIDATISLNVHFSTEPTRVTLRDNRADTFYFYFVNGGIVRSADSKTKLMSAPLLDQVLSYKPFGENLIMYATTKGAIAGKLAVNVYDGSKDYKLGDVSFDASNTYFLDVAQFEKDWYFVTGSRSSDRVQIFKNPQNFANAPTPKPPTVLATLRSGIPDFVGFSTNTRFIMAQSQNSVAVYDAEDKQVLDYELPFQPDTGVKASWMDGHRFQIISSNQLYVIEYDGKNSRALQKVKAPMAGYFNNNFERLFTVAPKADGNVMQESSLVLKK